MQMGLFHITSVFSECCAFGWYLTIRLYCSTMKYVLFATHPIQVNLDMADSMGPGKLVRHMQNPLYTYEEYNLDMTGHCMTDFCI